MPIMVSYNFQGADGIHNNRIQSMFERFGWQQVGGSCYRYPRLAQVPDVEDWLNHVIPALMLFRTYILGHAIVMSKLSIDAHSSTGVCTVDQIGNQPQSGDDIEWNLDAAQHFGQQQLQGWVNGITVPYLPQEPAG